MGHSFPLSQKITVLVPELKTWVVLTLLLQSHVCVKCEKPKVFVHSYYSFEYLAAKEQLIFNKINGINPSVTSNNSVALTISRYKEDYLQTQQILVSQSDSNLIASQPLLAYRMIHRYSNYITVIFQNSSTPNLKSVYSSIKNSIGWPTESDAQNAMRGIFRLQHVYDLDLKEFVTFDDDDSLYYVRAGDCYELGNFAVKEGYFSIGIEWLEFGIFLVNVNEKDNSIRIDVLKKSLDEAIAAHDSEWDMMPNSRFDSELYTTKLGGAGNSSREKRRTYLANYYKGQRDERFRQINFWALCSGEDMRTELEKSELFCWLESKSNSAWRIKPLKIEQLSNAPYLLQIYEAIPSKIMDTLIKESEQKLQQSLSSTFGQNYLSRQRTSLQYWLEESQLRELAPFPGIVESITGLITKRRNSSEKIQVAAYTFGNHFDIHRDVITSHVKNIQNDRRIATFMVYLSDVEEGGYTGFPIAGVAAKPVKGSAVFWYNLKRNGDIDEATWHGGCPVRRGHKWVANKWINSHAQFKTRQCSVDPNE